MRMSIKAGLAGLTAVVGGWVGHLDHVLSPWIWLVVLLLVVDLIKHTKTEPALFKQVAGVVWGVFVLVATLIGQLPSALDVHNLLQGAVFALALSLLYVTFPKWFQWVKSKLGFSKELGKLASDIKTEEHKLFGHQSPNVPPPSGTH